MLGHPGDRQGQHRDERHAHDRRIAGARRTADRPMRSSWGACARPGRSSSARRTCPSGPTSVVSSRRAAGAGSAGRGATRTRSIGTRAARAPAPAAAAAANLATVTVGTETDGSIVCPAGANGLVGIKPSLGLASRSGIVPLSAQQDTAGPMARNVTDAAVLLGVMTGVDPDGPGDRDQHRPCLRGLHPVPRQERPPGCPHRRLAPGQLRAQPGDRRDHGGHDRPPGGTRGDDRRPGRHPDRGRLRARVHRAPVRVQARSRRVSRRRCRRTSRTRSRT